MSSASDISNLFQMLGVSPLHYQEIQRAKQVQSSRGRGSTQPESAPVALKPDHAVRAAEAVLPATMVNAAPAMSSQPGTSAVSAAATGSIPVLQATPEQPALHFHSSSEPFIAAQQPDTLSAVFARLRETNVPQADVQRRQTS